MNQRFKTLILPSQNKHERSLRLNKTEIKSLLRKHFTIMWQLRWDQDSSFLKSIHKIVSKTHAYNLIHRKHEIILFRMRSGNIGLNTNLQKLGKHDTGLCDYCNQPETIQHYLLDCPKYLIPRAMLLAETNKIDQKEITEELLTAKNPNTQMALIDFFYRSQRFH